MTPFTDREHAFLDEDPGLARLATVGPDGTPHVVPTGWRREPDALVITGYHLEASKKWRDVERSGRAALVIDDVLPPWRPRGIEVRGRAEAVRGDEPAIRLYPERIISWGLESEVLGEHHARSVPDAAVR